jgi:hypothetical protein
VVKSILLDLGIYRGCAGKVVTFDNIPTWSSGTQTSSGVTKATFRDHHHTTLNEVGQSFDAPMRSAARPVEEILDVLVGVIDVGPGPVELGAALADVAAAECGIAEGYRDPQEEDQGFHTVNRSRGEERGGREPRR